ncbi:MAG: DUF2141 domain-containing protein [Maribacter sp.]
MGKLTTLILLFCLTNVFAQDASLGAIELEMDTIENDEGQMLIGLYDAEENWLNKIRIGKVGVIKKGKSRVIFENIPEGTYAISVFHDQDNNGKLKTFLGIPTEGTGSSNNAPARFGPPKWEDAKFQVQGNSIEQKINR